MSAKFKGFRNNIEKKLGNEFFLFHKKKVPVVFKEEYLKPYYFHDVKVTELLAQLQNAAPKFAVLRNLDKWDQDNFDINRIRFECAWLTELGGGVEQHTVIKERRVPLQQLPTSDAPVVDAVVEVAGKAKHFLGVDDHEEYEEKDSEFEYYFEHEPDTRQPDVELLLTASGLKPLMAHHWEKHSFRRPQNCAQCNKFIWGLTKQGHCCKVCLKPSHTRCYTLIPPHCPGVPMTKAEQRDRAIRKAWAKMDKDGNGSLSYSELTKHLGMTEEEAVKFLKAYDQDKNSRLEYDEFVHLVKKHFVAAFRQFDRNDDGEITPKELKEGFKDLGMTLSAKQLLKQFSDMDLDDDGAITLDEFIEASFITIALQAAEEGELVD